MLHGIDRMVATKDIDADAQMTNEIYKKNSTLLLKTREPQYRMRYAGGLVCSYKRKL